MKLFIIGANGHSGRQLINLGLGRNHQLTAYVRSPQKIARQDPRLEIVRGDPLNANQLADALVGQDAVLSALGVRPPQAFRPHTIVEQGALRTVAAMTRAGVNRLILVSAAALFPGDGFLFGLVRFMLTYIRHDLEKAENIVRAAPLEWTIARPPRLTNGSGETYRAAPNALPPNGFSLPFRALAAFMLDAVEQHSHVREIVGLAT